MKKVLFILILSLSSLVFAQTISREDWEHEVKPIIEQEVKTLKDEIKMLESSNRRLNTEINILKEFLSVASTKIESLQNQTQANRDDINKTAHELGLKITTSEKTTNQKISEVDDSLSKSLSKTALWAIIGILAAIVVSGVVYWLLRKKQQSDKTDLIEQLSKTKSALEESLVKEFGKQSELMEEQLELMKQQNNSTVNVEADHSLALKVADEITLIERNISHMNQETKGLKPLIRAIERLKDNLLSKGYEMTDLLRKPYVEGMRITIITSMPDETLEKGKDIITKIIKPQVNFDGKIIQIAQVEVTVGVK